MMPASRPGFSAQVLDQIERFKTLPLREIEARVARKRTAWFEGRAQECAATPRRAFEILFFEYMGLAPEDLPVVRESEDEIVWSSRNPCPTLEACRVLGLDTRTVCRAAYEKPTQAFVSCIDPQLRFLRDYGTIRPWADECRERIVRVPFEERMRLAIEEARESRGEGNKGYGAVAVLGERVLARAHDTAITARDPSLHAEMNVLREATRVLASDNLSGVVLFATCEPCPMCAALAVWANASAIVFGASIEKTAARGKLRIDIPAREVVARSPVMMETIGGVLEQECLALY